MTSVISLVILAPLHKFRELSGFAIKKKENRIIKYTFNFRNEIMTQVTGLGLPENSIKCIYNVYAYCNNMNVKRHCNSNNILYVCVETFELRYDNF